MQEGGASAWQEEAKRRFPDIRELSDWLEDPYALWIELRALFVCAYEDGDMSMVARIYSFANWCVEQSQIATDLITPVATCFYEHIPANEKSLKDMPRWFSLDQVFSLREAFSHLVGSEGFYRIVSLYPEGEIFPGQDGHQD